MSSGAPLRVAHVITGLQVGGAERGVQRVALGLRDRGIEPTVVSLGPDGPIGEALAGEGVRVEAVGLRPSRPDPRRVLRLRSLLGTIGPDVVQTWLFHGDLIGGLAARKLAPVVWNIRQSSLDDQARWTTNGAAHLCARLSRRVPTRIVANSAAGADAFGALGYDRSKMVVIPNGVDVDRFRPDPAARARLRAELEVGEDVAVAVSVGRWDPQKDHASLIEAWSRRSGAGPTLLVLCGQGCDGTEPGLLALLDRHELREQTRLLGVRADLPAVLAGSDVYVQSSKSEGMPNAVAEAMAVGLPVVATAVGDTEVLLGGTGELVPPHDPGALAAALDRVLALGPEGRRAMGEAGRRRVTADYAPERELAAYEQLYRELAAGRTV